MAKGFSTMQTNVGNNVQDTSTALATKIGVWINDGYQDAWNRYMWEELIDHDKTFESVASQATYSFSSDMSITDFGEELFVADIANGHKLERKTLGWWWEERAGAYSADALDSGNPVRYVVLPEAGKLMLDPPPDTAETYAMPYKKRISTLSGTTAPSIADIEAFLEAYATAQALAYKRRIADSDWWMNRAEFELRKLMQLRRSRSNQRYQFVPRSSGHTRITRLTGDASYDSV